MLPSTQLYMLPSTQLYMHNIQLLKAEIINFSYLMNGNKIPYIGNRLQTKTFTICQLSQCSRENVHKFSDSVMKSKEIIHLIKKRYKKMFANAPRFAKSVNIFFREQFLIYGCMQLHNFTLKRKMDMCDQIGRCGWMGVQIHHIKVVPQQSRMKTT